MSGFNYIPSERIGGVSRCPGDWMEWKHVLEQGKQRHNVNKMEDKVKAGRMIEGSLVYQ